MSHLAPSYHILWLSKSFRKLALFLVPFCHGKSQFSWLTTCKVCNLFNKKLFHLEELLSSNKDKQKRATFADILDARISFTAVCEKFCHLKTPISGQKWQEIHVFLENG